MKEISIMLLDNNRSKAYLQNFIRFGYTPRHAIVLGATSANDMPGDRLTHILPEFQSWFDSGESVYETLEKNNISCTFIGHLDINAPEVIDCVRELETQYVIYSGPAGAILRDALLGAGKTFIHAHPGLLPDFKGSTTVYYSMLLKKEIGCSVIEMNREIDSGDILMKKTFPVPRPPVDFDMVVDPMVRTETLLSWLGGESLPIIKNALGNTYYIIHPVLKHLARKENMQDDKGHFQ